MREIVREAVVEVRTLGVNALARRLSRRWNSDIGIGADVQNLAQLVTAERAFDGRRFIRHRFSPREKTQIAEGRRLTQL